MSTNGSARWNFCFSQCLRLLFSPHIWPTCGPDALPFISLSGSVLGTKTTHPSTHTQLTMATELSEIQLDLRPLRELGHRQDELLEEIDDLRSFGIGIGSLPQIVVIGDVSSGKSSVLEAISGLPFPTSSGVCTLLAIEVRLQTSPKLKIEILAVQEDGRARNTKFEGGMLTNDKLAEKFREALSTMCEPNRLSNEILRVKVCGPDLPNLTLVDLPGLILQGTSPGSRLPHPSETLARRYLGRKNTLILGVINAAQPLAQQKALDIAKEFNGPRERTIGIVTKPDGLEKYGNDLDYMDLVQNRNPKHKLRWSWHILKNRDRKDNGEDTCGRTTCNDRDKAEKEFFSLGIWKNVQSKVKGAHELRRKIAALLSINVAKEMDALDGQTLKRIQDEEKDLKDLGIWCNSDNESSRRTFLREFACKFRDLATEAVPGSCLVVERGVADASVYPTTLRSTLGDLNAAFALAISRTSAIEPMMNQMYQNEVPVQCAHSAFASWISKLCNAGSLDLTNTEPQFETHNRILKWHAVASQYIILATEIAVSFITQILLDISGNNQRLVSVIKEEFAPKFLENRRVELTDELKRLVQSYVEGNPDHDQRRHRQSIIWGRSHNEGQAQSQLALYQPPHNQVPYNPQQTLVNTLQNQANHDARSDEVFVFDTVCGK